MNITFDWTYNDPRDYGQQVIQHEEERIMRSDDSAVYLRIGHFVALVVCLVERVNKEVQGDKNEFGDYKFAGLHVCWRSR